MLVKDFTGRAGCSLHGRTFSWHWHTNSPWCTVCNPWQFPNAGQGCKCLQFVLPEMGTWCNRYLCWRSSALATGILQAQGWGRWQPISLRASAQYCEHYLLHRWTLKTIDTINSSGDTKAKPRGLWNRTLRRGMEANWNDHWPLLLKEHYV